jgi:hypothetical protein
MINTSHCGIFNKVIINFSEILIKYMRFEVLTGVTMKSTFVWDATICSFGEVKKHFGGTYEYCRLHEAERATSK